MDQNKSPGPPQSHVLSGGVGASNTARCLMPCNPSPAHTTSWGTWRHTCALTAYPDSARSLAQIKSEHSCVAPDAGTRAGGKDGPCLTRPDMLKPWSQPKGDHNLGDYAQTCGHTSWCLHLWVSPWGWGRTLEGWSALGKRPSGGGLGMCHREFYG